MPTIALDEFAKLDIRVGRVVEVSNVPGARKLVRMMIDIGGVKKQSVAGLGSHYSPEDLNETDVVVVTNLSPKKIFGIESQVMLLAAVEDDLVSLLRPDRQISPGAKVG